MLNYSSLKSKIILCLELIIIFVCIKYMFFKQVALCEETNNYNIIISHMLKELGEILEHIIQRQDFKAENGFELNIKGIKILYQPYDYYYLVVMKQFIKDFVHNEKCLSILLDLSLSPSATEKKILDLFFYEINSTKSALNTKIFANLVQLGPNIKTIIPNLNENFKLIEDLTRLYNSLYTREKNILISVWEYKQNYNIYLNNSEYINKYFNISINMDSDQIYLYVEIFFCWYKLVIYKF